MFTNRQSLLDRHSHWVILLLLALGLGIWMCANTLRQADEAADSSAHAAFTQEICDQLAAIPMGTPYPAKLTDLSLTFPDGGDSSLLNRFEYSSNGASCTLKTVLVGGSMRREIVCNFPEDGDD
jgi:hypothetical protein